MLLSLVSGGAELGSPPDAFANLWGWWTPASMNISGGKLTSWTDLGPNGYTLNHGGSAPDIVTGPNSFDAVDIDASSVSGAEHLETSNSAANLKTLHMFWVLRVDNYVTAGRFITHGNNADGSSGRPAFISDHSTADRPEIRAFDGASKYAGTPAAIVVGTWMLCEGIWDSGSEIKFSVDGAIYNSTAIGTITDTQDFDHMVLAASGPGFDAVDTSFGEGFLFTDIKTEDEVASLRAYLIGKYGAFGTW